MAEIRIANLQSRVDVTDPDALLSPQVMARIVAVVKAELEQQSRTDQARLSETRIGGQGGRS
ncbi:hypothetical protein LH51_10580 [Nitrincola sp. A-D6]|uniref:hypothetical protein n=1 Tax=Nitrincola sp. A-D6 TaxID=1545442 RepID=UPI00051FDCCF|nr:hypothetical protein [Nitrincola sp. A-D6]KGK41982.1 hypothetical protein LH51_10580 [Nitrincola sp. A-D6]